MFIHKNSCPFFKDLFSLAAQSPNAIHLGTAPLIKYMQTHPAYQCIYVLLYSKQSV